MLARTILIQIFVIASQSIAGLEWEKKSIKLRAQPGETSATVDFMFRNGGSEGIAIDRVKTSCGCTKAMIGKKSIASGEQGSIEGQFDFGTREGIQRKRFEVFTSDGKRETLYLTIDIPRTYQVTPKRLSWNSPEDRSSKSCKMVNASNTPIKIVSAKSSKPAFNVEIKELRSGFEYEVLVKPIEYTNSARAIISIVAEPVNGHKPRTYKIFAVSQQH